MTTIKHAFLGLLGAAALALAGLGGIAIAGEREAALLQSFVGQFSGRGELVGETTETVACQLSVSSSGAQRLRYSGRCVIAGERIPLRGTIAYSDRNGRFEAAASGMGTVAGTQRGNSLAFSMGRSYRQRGQEGTFQVSFVLSEGSVLIELRVSDEANGAFRGRVPLARS